MHVWLRVRADGNNRETTEDAGLREKNNWLRKFVVVKRANKRKLDETCVEVDVYESF